MNVRHAYRTRKENRSNFSDDFEFKIPDYQRPYAWKPQQAGELLDDLLSFMQLQPLPVDEMSPYFLGSIVLIKRKESPDADVVDGQQRLTTLTLLLAALRAHLPDHARDITPLLYQAGNAISGTQDRFRLQLRKRDHKFFQEFVQHESGFSRLIESTNPLSDSQSLLRDNARLFHERLQALPADTLTLLAQVIVTRCYLVVVSTPDLDSAYRIFSVMNSRGLDLSATDILKASILGGIPEKSRDSYTEKWEEAETRLGRDHFIDLFGHIRMIYRKAKQQGTLLREFQQYVCEHRKPEAVISDIIIPYADLYDRILHSNYNSAGQTKGVNHSLYWLNQLVFSDWIPPALAYASKHKNDATGMEKFFRELERLAYAMRFLRHNVNKRIERFARLIHEIEIGSDLFTDNSPLELSPDEKSDLLVELNEPIYEKRSSRTCKLILLRLDELLSGGGASYDHPVITVEHILPQNPSAGSQWLKWFPDAEERKYWTHRLGNLVLLTRKKNSSASNYELAQKKNAYFTKDGISPFPLTTGILQHSLWDVTAIKERQHMLLSLLKEYWQL